MRQKPLKERPLTDPCSGEPLFWVVTLRVPLFEARYMIIVLPFYLFFVAGGLLRLRAWHPALLAVGSMALNSADDRTWRALPSEVAVARTRLPRGRHQVRVQTLEGEQAVPVSVSGRYAVVDFRLMRRQVFVCAPKAEVAR